MLNQRYTGQEEVASFEASASQRGKQAKKFGDVSVLAEYFYLYENYKLANFCTARCKRVYPQCDIEQRKAFNAECWDGGLFPELKNYDLNTFVLVD